MWETCESLVKIWESEVDNFRKDMQSGSLAEEFIRWVRAARQAKGEPNSPPF